MSKHVFGATSSPSCANFCLKKTASSYGKELDPKVAETIQRNMYVDDLMKSVGTTEIAIKLVKQLRELLKKGGFRLMKWLNNDREVLAEIPENERASSVVSLAICPQNVPLELDGTWRLTNVYGKSMRKHNSPGEKRAVTRRGILSMVYSLFDPLGLIALYIMKAKLLLQELCRKKRGWDGDVDAQEKQQWSRWLEDLSRLEEIKTERCFKPREFDEIKST